MSPFPRRVVTEPQLHQDDFAQLVADHHAGLRAFIRTLGVDPEWVDDLAQETFLVANREHQRFDTDRDLGKWLRGIARNLVRNEIRKGARRQRLLHEGLSQLLLESEATDSAVDDVKGLRLSALQDCVEKLPEKSRELVARRYTDGWSAKDMATHVGMTAVSIRQALVRIRRSLKRCIEARTAAE